MRAADIFRIFKIFRIFRKFRIVRIFSFQETIQNCQNISAIQNSQKNYSQILGAIFRKVNKWKHHIILLYKCQEEMSSPWYVFAGLFLLHLSCYALLWRSPPTQWSSFPLDTYIIPQIRFFVNHFFHFFIVIYLTIRARAIWIDFIKNLTKLIP